MPFAQAGLAGFLAAEVTEILCDQFEVEDRSERELLKAGACISAALAVGIPTVDPAGIGIAGAETIAHLIGAAQETKVSVNPISIFK